MNNKCEWYKTLVYPLKSWNYDAEQGKWMVSTHTMSMGLITHGECRTDEMKRQKEDNMLLSLVSYTETVLESGNAQFGWLM
jgi:hypothetical protein